MDGFDALLRLTPAQKKAARVRHLFGGMPVAPAGATREIMLHQKDYLIWYDGDLRVPLWVAYRLTKEDLATPRTRLECFRKDPRLADQAAGTCDDYDEPNFDRGHLAPNADFVRSESSMLNTYMFSNMTPQFGNFNRGVWEKLEADTRTWTKLAGTVFAISGAVFDKNRDGRRDADRDADRVKPLKRVAIPTQFYKILVRLKPDGSPESLAILLTHAKTKQDAAKKETTLTQGITTIRMIERITGIDFFPELPHDQQESFEKAKAHALWGLN
jgi:DNA/RNA endonuclease G (NUC1)